jgi:predicted nucleic acid-binding protein
MMFTLDASVIARSFDPADSAYAICQELIDVLEQRAVPVIVPRLLLAEVAGVVRRLTRDPIRARLAVDIWRSYPHVHLVSLVDPLIDAAAELAADHALRGADAAYVAVALEHRCALVSLDREQRERAAHRVRTLTPAEALAELRAAHS